MTSPSDSDEHHQPLTISPGHFPYRSRTTELAKVMEAMRTFIYTTEENDDGFMVLSDEENRAEGEAAQRENKPEATENKDKENDEWMEIGPGKQEKNGTSTLPRAVRGVQRAVHRYAMPPINAVTTAFAETASSVAASAAAVSPLSPFHRRASVTDNISAAARGPHHATSSTAAPNATAAGTSTLRRTTSTNTAYLSSAHGKLEVYRADLARHKKIARRRRPALPAVQEEAVTADEYKALGVSKAWQRPLTESEQKMKEGALEKWRAEPVKDDTSGSALAGSRETESGPQEK